LQWENRRRIFFQRLDSFLQLFLLEYTNSEVKYRPSPQQKGQPMLPIKINCACGQRYAFDVEPVNGRMPAPVACPVCGVDGTAVANDIIAQNMTAPPPPLTGGATVVSTSAGQGAVMLARHIAAASQRSGGGFEGRKWKWWYLYWPEFASAVIRSGRLTTSTK
jgi:hypothetical protein